MSKVTLKGIKEAQAKIDANKEDGKKVWLKLHHESAEIEENDKEQTKLNREILEIVKNLGILSIERKNLWKKSEKTRKQREVLLKLGSNLSTNLNKLKRKYWEKHGIQD